MLKITVLCVGKLKEKHYISACQEYLKRLGAYASVLVSELPELPMGDGASRAQISDALEREAEGILKKIPKGAFVIPLCVEGELLSSEDLAARISKLQVQGVSNVCFLIGGSNGLSDTVKRLGGLKLSMSRMTFPHHLARVMLLEQIYRAFQILQGGNYHK
ncbi:MAG: 23S rRNA (pseudouridine(1915)-N(3))-methyltransferase RlmH [Oscillospiraceae bacterium]|nr:23S rRNA (pseudouridine(1915)-N(3))-methyltransferase RlmH [Oscillospiraceae bacterium]